MLLFRYTMIVPLFRCWIVVSRKFVAHRSSWVVLVAIVCVLGKLLKIKVYLKYVQLLLNKAKHRDKEVLIVVQTTKHTHLPCCVQTADVVVAVVFVAVVPADQPAAAHAPRSADPAGARFPQSADHPEPHAS